MEAARSLPRARGYRVYGRLATRGRGRADVPAGAAPQNMLLRTCSALVGLTLPEALAEGAAIGRPAARKRARASVCEGILIATESPPAVTSFEIELPAFSGRTSVKAPGQKACAKASSSGPNSAMDRAASRSGKCTIKGLKLGRFFAEKICHTKLRVQ